jgi:hypothetical protein
VCFDNRCEYGFLKGIIMRPTALVLLSATLVIGYAGWAQVPAAPMPPAEDNEAPREVSTVMVIPQSPPLTKLEAFESRKGIAIVRRYSAPAIIQADTGAVQVSAVVLKNMANDESARGIAVQVYSTRTGKVASSYIDEDEIAPLLDALSALPKLARDDSPMTDFSGRFATRGNFEVLNVDIDGARTALLRSTRVASLTGEVATATTRIRIARLAELRQQVVAAKEQLEKVK